MFLRNFLAILARYIRFYTDWRLFLQCFVWFHSRWDYFIDQSDFWCTSLSLFEVCLRHLAWGCLGTTAARQATTMLTGSAGADSDPAHSYNSGLATCLTPRLSSRRRVCQQWVTSVSVSTSPSHREWQIPVIVSRRSSANRQLTASIVNHRRMPATRWSSPSYVTGGLVSRCYVLFRSVVKRVDEPLQRRTVQCHTSVSAAQRSCTRWMLRRCWAPRYRPAEPQQSDVAVITHWLTVVFDFIFSFLFFVSLPCARLSWPSRQLLSAR